MLVITRKKGEGIILGDDIELTVTQIDNGSVKIAIDAPKKIVILRKELFEAVREENKNASTGDLNILKSIKLDK